MSYNRVITAPIGGGAAIADGGTNAITQAAAALNVLPSATALQQLRKNAGNTAWEAFTPSAATGDVVGPGSATDNAACRFDTTTGKLIQNCQMSFGDAGGPVIFDNGGGNTRGNNAVDLQTSRSAATQVASGANACIPGGLNNTASAQYATAAGGGNNVSGASGTAFGTNNVVNGPGGVALGDQNSAGSASYCTAIGRLAVASATGSTALGYGANSTGNYSVAVGPNTCSNQYNFACGEQAIADKLGMVAIGWLNIAGPAAGGIQSGWLGYVANLSTASQTEITLNGTGSTYLTLVDGDCYDCYFQLLARQSSGVFAAWAEVAFTIQRTGANTSLVGTTTGLTPARTDAGATLAGSQLDITADDANDRLAVKVTGADANATYYLGVLRFNKVKKA